MKKRVLHFVRKSSQLKASFIKNQISNHIDFTPYVLYRMKIDKENDGGFADFNLNKYLTIDLSYNETLFEKIRNRSSRTLSSRQIKLILDYIIANEIEICHFHYGTDCGVFYPLLKKLNIPSVVSFYGYDCSSFPSFFFGFGKRYLNRRVFNQATAVFAMSPDMRVDLIKAGCSIEKIIVHYAGTDTKTFYHQPKHTSKDTIHILNLASLVPQKGQFFLLKSISRLIEKGISNFNLRIVGTGELYQELKNYISENSMDEFVTLVGVLKYGSNEMLNEYQKADIFVHPSVVAPNGDKEGIPGTIIEAMSSGIPVVSTYHAGIPFIIQNGKTGILVNEHDVSALADAIEKLISNHELRKELANNGQMYSIKNLDLHSNEIELEKVYSSLMNKNYESKKNH